MQKKILALAVAGLMSGAAFAQSNVTIYGVVDLGYLDYRSGNITAANVKSKKGIDSGNLASSRIGFRGTEDLGGGLSASFTVETSLAADDPVATSNIQNSTSTQPTNPTRLGDRVSTVSLSGKNWGTISMGRMAHLTNAHHGRYTVLNGTAIDPTRNAARAATRGGGNTWGDGEMYVGSRVSNTLAYTSPSFSGFTAAVAYDFSGTAETGEIKNVTDTTSRNAWNLSADYAAGPLGVGLAYMRVGNTAGLAAGAENGIRQWNLGGRYDFGKFELRANYARQTHDRTGPAQPNKATLWGLGGLIKVSDVGTIHIAHSTSRRNTANDLQLGGRAWGLAYTHAMSKRTTAYAAWGDADNRRNATGNFFGVATEADKGARAFAVGLNHRF